MIARILQKVHARDVDPRHTRSRSRAAQTHTHPRVMIFSQLRPIRLAQDMILRRVLLLLLGLHHDRNQLPHQSGQVCPFLPPRSRSPYLRMSRKPKSEMRPVVVQSQDQVNK